MEIFDKKNQKVGAFDFTESVFKEDDVEIYKKYFSPESPYKRNSDMNYLRCVYVFRLIFVAISCFSNVSDLENTFAFEQ